VVVSEKPAFEVLVGVNVVDDAGYTEYRRLMTPLLVSYGGSFGVDVRVAAVLRSPEDRPYNRLFTIRFPSQAVHDAFFADSDYLDVRRRHFESSVSGTVLLGRYQRLA
jgi:uncharacterized protein (DUF1330 family)